LAPVKILVAIAELRWLKTDWWRGGTIRVVPSWNFYLCRHVQNCSLTHVDFRPMSTNYI